MADPNALRKLNEMRVAGLRMNADPKTFHLYRSMARKLGLELGLGDKLMGFTVTEDPCDYCGRTIQTNTHTRCDGCGANKHGIVYNGSMRHRSETAYGYYICRPNQVVQIKWGGEIS